MKKLANGIVALGEAENSAHFKAIQRHLTEAKLVGLELRPFQEGSTVFCEYTVYDDPSLPITERRTNQHSRARQIISALGRQRVDAVRKRLEAGGYAVISDVANREN